MTRYSKICQKCGKKKQQGGNDTCPNNPLNSMIAQMMKGELPPESIKFLNQNKHNLNKNGQKHIDDIIANKKSDAIKAENIETPCKIPKNQGGGGDSWKIAVTASVLVAISTSVAVYSTYATLPHPCSESSAYISSLIAGVANVPNLDACAINEKIRTEILQGIGQLASKGVALTGITGFVTNYFLTLQKKQQPLIQQ